jgi:hypothetical protein
MIKLFEYFGFIGILSIVCWLTAWGLCVLNPRGLKRTRPWWMAFGLAIVGLILASITFEEVASIVVDRSEELEEGMKRQEELRTQEDAAKETDADDTDASDASHKPAAVRFAEDSPSDAMDLAGVDTKTNQPSNKFEAAALGHGMADDAQYAYRRRGKQERVVAGEAVTNNLAGSVAPEEVAQKPARKMKEPDAIAAKKLGRTNFLLARLTFWVLLTLVIVDYLGRFNLTFHYLYPLPLAGAWIDAIWPKQHAVHAPGRRGDDLRGHLEDVIRKGETFIYCGPRDLWTATALPRLRWRQWTLWPMRTLSCQRGDGYDSEFLCESAWFGRYAIVMAGDPDRARRLMADLAGFLSMRYVTRARARRMVHLVWDLDAVPAEPVLEKLAGLAPEVNFKLFVTTPSAPSNMFGEIESPR